MMVLLRNVCIILISIICCLCINQQCTADSAVDISWDFGDGSDLQGWADATAAEMQSRVTLHGGEMQGVILGLSPNVASPLMAVFVKNRHYLVLRMAYSGKSSMGELLISRGHLTEDSQDYVNYRKFTWSDYKTPVALVGSPSSSSGSGIAATIDSSSNTYYLSASAAGVYIIYDLGDYRWVTGFEITPLQGGNSPRKCLLQRSLTFSDRGPYETASTFTLNSTVAVNDTVTGVRIIIGLSAHARYWRLLVIDNYGGMGVGIRHIAFTGYANSVDVVPFILNNTGDYITYYLPMTVRDITSPPVIRVRLNFFPALISSPSILTELGSFQIDFVRIARAPEIFRVTGCLDLYFSNSSLLEPSYSLNSVVDIINGNLPNSYYTMGHIIPVNKLYASTYSCPRDGGLDITIQGSNFGESANVLIGANSCLVISREKIRIGGVVFDTIICTLPATNSALLTSHIKVRVQNGVLPNLFDEYPGLQYEMVPYPPTAPNVTNIGARRVDLVWQPSNSVLENLVVTGYKIAWSTPVTTSSSTSTATSAPHGGSFTVGNVTTTSIRGLSRETEYIFRIAAMSEGVVPLNAAALPTDQYGRREPAPLALISSFSEFSQSIVTLKEDFQFTLFNANLIQNHTKKIDPDHLSSGASVGPTGQYGGEGQYGLTFVGSASIQNCNASSTCCDGYNIFNGSSSCISTSLVCAVLPSRQFYKSLIIDDHRLTQISSINNDPDDGLPSTYLFTYDLFSSLTGLNPPSSICGPAIRLTSSAAREVGATWYARKVNVAEGFDTTFSFEISNPSLECNIMDDVHTFCRSRGADGLAFVIQDSKSGLKALGSGGSGLGYSGIDNALSVEFDTYMNYENLDSFENHVSVLTQGYRNNLTSNHSRALATITRVQDLTDGPHKVRIRYDPNFDPNAVTQESFTVTGHTSFFIENADYANGGEGDWGIGFGLLYVYVDDLISPIIITPLNLAATLRLDNGRAYVGFTAATGDRHWQAQDLLNWEWTSLFLNTEYTAPIIVNGEGAHECVDIDACVHPVDYDHYLRTDSTFNDFDDGVKGW